MIFGALTKEIDRKQFLDIKPGSSLLGFSLEATAKATLDIWSSRCSPTPLRSSYGTSCKCDCNLHSFIVSQVGVSDGLIDGLTLNNFPRGKDFLRTPFPGSLAFRAAAGLS